MSQAAGWYPDPSGQVQERYWDGEEWTSQTRSYPAPARPSPASSMPEPHSIETATSNVVAPARARSLRLWLTVAVIAAAVVIVGVFVTWRQSVDASARRAAAFGASLGSGVGSVNLGDQDQVFSGPISVTYRISKTGPTSEYSFHDASVTYETPTGTQQGDVDDGWSRTFTFQPGDFVYVSVQNGGSGSVSCTIEGSSGVISTNSSSGEFKIATCDGRAE